MPKIHQLLYIHGGETFASYQEYIQNLQDLEYDPYQEKKSKWPEKLAENLGSKYQVFSPRMPSSSNAKYLEWKIWFEKVLPFLNSETVLVGWSLGGIFLAKYLSENTFPVKISKLILVAPVFDEDELSNQDGKKESLADFNFKPEKLKNISKQVANITIFVSEDDFVVPFSHSLKYQKHFPSSKLIKFTDRNHFLQEDFPELIKEIKLI